MSSDPQHIGNGILISTYTGPATTDPADRRRWQLCIMHPDTGERQIVMLDSSQKDTLTMYLYTHAG